MTTVTIPGVQRPTSRLGFGCSALIGGRSEPDARRLLDTALDAGITHFDVARVYGTGDAESVVGAFASAHQDEITIATKFGIDPLPPTATVAVAKRAVRALARRSRSVTRLVQRRSGLTVRRGRFTPEHARSSLATSLRALGSDRVDVLLLHDCTAREWAQPELQDVLAASKAAGTIGAFGPATSRSTVAEILAAGDPTPDLVQHDLSWVPSDGEGSGVFRIVHGVHRELMPVLRARVVGDPETARSWSDRLDVDAADLAALARLALASALAREPTGIVLIATGRIDRIGEAVSVLASPPDPEQIAHFDELVTHLV